MIPMIVNGLLVLTSGYASYEVTPAHPYAFTACAFAFCHGMFGIIQFFMPQDCESTSKGVFDSIMEVLPISLINMELYMDSESKDIAVAHWFFVLPLSFDVIARLFTEEGEDSATQALKEVTVIGNVLSLSYLGFQEGKVMYYVLAAVVLLAKYGSMALMLVEEELMANAAVGVNAILYVILALAYKESTGEEGSGNGSSEGDEGNAEAEPKAEPA